MGQAVPKMIGDACREYLRLILQPPERAGMHHAVAVPLKFVAVRMRQFRIAPSQCVSDWKFKMGKVPWHLL